MPNSHAEKAQARAYAAEHNCSYTTALRVIRDVNDPLSFRGFLGETGREDCNRRDVRDIVRRHPKFPGGRDIAAIRAYPPIYSLKPSTPLRTEASSPLSVATGRFHA